MPRPSGTGYSGFCVAMFNSICDTSTSRLDTPNAANLAYFTYRLIGSTILILKVR